VTNDAVYDPAVVLWGAFFTLSLSFHSLHAAEAEVVAPVRRHVPAPERDGEAARDLRQLLHHHDRSTPGLLSRRYGFLARS